MIRAVSVGGDLVEMPRLEGVRVVLRGFVAGDVGVVLDASRDPLIPLITTVPAAASEGLALEWVRRQQQRLRDGVGYSFCIASISSGEALGQIGLWPHRPGRGRASIGYWVGRSHRRGGVATEALRLLTGWGIDHPGIERLELYVEPWNEGSWRAAERAGFRREGLLRRWEAVGGQHRDMFMYSLLPEDPRL